MRRQISMISDVSESQAFWLLGLVLPNGSVVIQAIRRCDRSGIDNGERYHITYHPVRKTYTVILDLREE